MAQKFSLKDNPIFQRLEVPKPKQIREEVNVNREKEVTSEIEPLVSLDAKVSEGHNMLLKNRASKIDPQDDTFIQEGIAEETQSLTVIEQPFSESEARITIQRVNTNESGKEDDDKRALASLTALSPDDTSKRNLPGINDTSSNSKDRELNIDPQILRVKNYPPNLPIQESDAEVVANKDEHKEPRNTQLADGELGRKLVFNLEDHIEKSQFFSFYNEVTDGLLPTLNPAEQILYSRLFRLSYGFNRNYCTVSQQLLRERTGLSRNTVRTGLQSLVLLEWLHVVDAGNHVSTTYRVILPREKESGAKSDPQNQRYKICSSNPEGQNLIEGRVKKKGAKI